MRFLHFSICTKTPKAHQSSVPYQRCHSGNFHLYSDHIKAIKRRWCGCLKRLLFHRLSANKGNLSVNKQKNSPELGAVSIHTLQFNLFYEIFHSAAQCTRKHHQVFCLGFIDVLLPLLILLDGAKRNAGNLCQFSLTESGLAA